MDVASLAAQNGFALSMVKQSAASSQALANLIESSAALSKALLDASTGGTLDISV